MRLPHRVPWASLAELDVLVTWIYSVPNDSASLQRACNRLAAWRAITALPHALEATHSLLAAILLDSCRFSAPASLESTHHALPSVLSLRQSYATACIRFINGLVDPLQSGTYARSIASIAAQIGLPLRLVELRHAATHEDLPSLESLRAATHEALDWLLNNYFLPTLSASAVPHRSIPTLTLHPLDPLLRQYKSILKAVTRDASLRNRYKDDVSRAVRAIERWTCEAKLAASATSLTGWGGVLDETDDNCENERWALERLCDGLLGRGGLVPVSSKKRLDPKHKSSPVLPSSLVDIWSPLLSSVADTHPTFPNVLVSAIADALLNQAAVPQDDLKRKGASSELCLAAWASWCVDQWSYSPEGRCTTSNALPKSMISNVQPLRREEVVIGLIATLALPDADVGDSKYRGARALLAQLVHGQPQLKQNADTLFATVRKAPGSTNALVDANDVFMMEERLRTLMPASGGVSSVDDDRLGMSIDIDDADASSIHYGDVLSSLEPNMDEDVPYGWSQVSTPPRKASPIGAIAM